ncbi:MAG: DALR domain-containing protein, partial [Bacteroidota bacterium]
ILIAKLFDLVRIINSTHDKKETLNEADIQKVKKLMNDFVINVLGLTPEEENAKQSKVLDEVMTYLLQMRQDAKAKKDFATSDGIRNHLAQHGIQIKDGKDGSTWSLNN